MLKHLLFEIFLQNEQRPLHFTINQRLVGSQGIGLGIMSGSKICGHQRVWIQ